MYKNKYYKYKIKYLNLIKQIGGNPLKQLIDAINKQPSESDKQKSLSNIRLLLTRHSASYFEINPKNQSYKTPIYFDSDRNSPIYYALIHYIESESFNEYYFNIIKLLLENCIYYLHPNSSSLLSILTFILKKYPYDKYNEIYVYKIIELLFNTCKKNKCFNYDEQNHDIYDKCINFEEFFIKKYSENGYDYTVQVNILGCIVYFLDDDEEKHDENFPLIKLFLTNGLNINSVLYRNEYYSRGFEHILFVAIEKKFIKLTKFLLDNNVDIKNPKKEVKVGDKYHNYTEEHDPFSYACKLYRNNKDKKIAKIIFLLMDKIINLNDPDILQKSLSRFYDSIDVTDPIFIEIIELLLNKNINVLKITMIIGKNHIIKAILQFLIEKQKINLNDALTIAHETKSKIGIDVLMEMKN